MIQVCIVCNKVYGEKEPLTLKDYTHGLCLECLEARLKLEAIGGKKNVAGRPSRKAILSER